MLTSSPSPLLATPDTDLPQTPELPVQVLHVLGVVPAGIDLQRIISSRFTRRRTSSSLSRVSASAMRRVSALLWVSSGSAVLELQLPAATHQEIERRLPLVRRAGEKIVQSAPTTSRSRRRCRGPPRRGRARTAAAPAAARPSLPSAARRARAAAGDRRAPSPPARAARDPSPARRAGDRRAAARSSRRSPSRSRDRCPPACPLWGLVDRGGWLTLQPDSGNDQPVGGSASLWRRRLAEVRAARPL